MSSPVSTHVLPAEGHSIPPHIPPYDSLVTEDDTPVDSLYSERLMRLLAHILHASWTGPGEGRSFLAMANVGLYGFDTTVHSSPIVPDVFLSLDVLPLPGDVMDKKNRCYYFWRYGKPPDWVLEIVSNKEGGELSTKVEIYAKLGILHYVVWDPACLLSDAPLQCFVLVGKKYEKCEPWFPALGLGLVQWPGVVEQVSATWLRWTDAEGRLIPTAEERAEQEKLSKEQERRRAEQATQRAAQENQRAEDATQRAEQEKQRADREKQRADQEKQRAEQEKQRAEQLAAQLRALGIDPKSQ